MRPENPERCGRDRAAPGIPVLIVAAVPAVSGTACLF